MVLPQIATKRENLIYLGKEGHLIMLSQKRGRWRPLSLLLINASALLAFALIIGMVFWLPTLVTHAANPNPNCTLVVPADALSAKGLATPYQLTNAGGGACHEANANQSAFVQGVIFDPATGNISVYSPLIIDKGTKPAIAPVVPALPAGAVIGLSFGFNGTNLTLRGAQGNTLQQANCVNGLNDSVFGQFAYCHTPDLFRAINQGIAAGKVQVPALGTAKDNMSCPTARDFSVIDQDQSDNVQSQYLANRRGQTAQFSAANQAAIRNATLIANPSDNALLTDFIDPALGCQSWTNPDLADNNNPVAAMVTDEIQAQVNQKAPIALMPLTDPMTELANARPSLAKTNLYRAGVDQPSAANANDASGKTYCQNFLDTGLPRVKLDQQFTVNGPSPVPAAANSLFTFLAMRANQSYTNLNCQNLLNIPNPIKLTTNGNGVVIGATFNLK